MQGTLESGLPVFKVTKLHDIFFWSVITGDEKLAWLLWQKVQSRSVGLTLPTTPELCPALRHWSGSAAQQHHGEVTHPQTVSGWPRLALVQSLRVAV